MSGRSKKPRNCGCKFSAKAFKPEGLPLSKINKVPIFRDELEALKLCDYDGLTQAEAGARMGISRGTVQRILTGARKKVAGALVECKALVCEEQINKKERKHGG